MAKKKVHVVKKKPVYKSVWFYLIVVVIAAALGILYILWGAPQVSQKQLRNLPQITTQIYDDNNKEIYNSSQAKNDYVKYDDIPKSYIDAVTAIEDKNFFHEKGFSVKGILNAFKTTFESKVLGRGVQVGGSGITQQLVKLSLFSTDASDRTLKRKLQEIWISVQVDSIYSKERQLEWYINKVYEGYGRYGAQTISRFYYGRNLNKLSVDQQALVAGLGQSPSVYNVYQNPEAVKKRRNLVLAAMQSTGAINKQQYQQSVQQPVNHGVVPIEKHERPANVRKIDDVVSNALQEAEEAGYKPRTESLKIYTSLNTKAQNVLYGQINDNPNFAGTDKALQGAATLVNVKNGEIQAQVGGRNKQVDFGLNRATQETRSSGSSIKPLLDYGPVIEKYGWHSQHVLNDSPYKYEGTNIQIYNYDRRYRGSVTMRKALVNSLNVPAVKAFEAAGARYASNFVRALGIDLKNPDDGSTIATISQALGTETSTQAMAGAYAAVSNGGMYNPPHLLRKVVSNSGTRTRENKALRVMSEGTAYTLVDMLKGVPSSNGTAKGAMIKGMPQAGKTGLNQFDASEKKPARAVKDSWYAGFTPNQVLVTWMGFDETAKATHYLSPRILPSGASEEDLPQYVYKDTMKRITNKKNDWKKPNDAYGTSGGQIGPVVQTQKYKQPSSRPGDANLNRDVDNLLNQKKMFVGGTLDPNYSKSDIERYHNAN